MQRVSRITDWRGLRRAMGLNQTKMALLLGVHRCHISRLETQARQPHKNTETMLRLVLQTKLFRTRLKANGYPYPFPEDLVPEDMA